ncbi:cytochrome P450 [Thermogemmatispora sp.]|uniref:cytochrome P450 n=1 Tax=Thermogemmatispora sp. TaxID=1968838 RepID=UPI001DD64A1F|nr:cytochrome P450 [Thermogemmatispora sp.]MBX5450932.1 cytochrome P450 [Thermogemmatispora sp.]
MQKYQNDSQRLTLSDVQRPEYLANPYPLYHRLRERDPIYWDEEMNAWVLTRYADVVAVLRDPRFSSAWGTLETAWMPEELRPQLEPALRAVSRQMLFLDPPDHSRIRGLVARAFTPRMVESLRPRVQRLVNELLDAIQPQGRIEFVADFAYPLPAIVIAEMLGVPAEDRQQFIAWTQDFGRLLDGSDLSFEELLKTLSSIAEFLDYFRRLIEQRRKAPRNDLLQALIMAEEQGDRLTEEELLGNCILLLAAGHGTTTHLLGNGLYALLQHPEQLQLLRDDPSLAPTAVMELLRYDSPVQLTSRRLKTDVDWTGRRFKAGEEVLTVLGAANRDPEQFPEPDRLDLRRADNRHLAFGHGPHFCLGAPLARLEAEVAFTTLLRRLPELRLETQEVERLPSMVFRGFKALPLTFATVLPATGGPGEG